MDSPAFQSLLINSSVPKNVLQTFLGLELAGAIGMTIILCTAIFSPRVKRCSTWYTFCASWIISCVSYSLLFFSGETRTASPGKGVCVTQAALVYSVPTLTACTTLSLLIHGWYNVHFGLSKLPLETHPRTMVVLLTTPFIIWFFMFIGFLTTGLQSFSIVRNSGLYCVFMSIMSAKVSSLLVIILTFSTIPIQASLALSLSRNFDPNNATSSISVQTVKMVIRVLVFSFLILIGFAEGVIHLLTAYNSPAVDLIMASLPVSAVIIFGIQRDLFETWAEWTGLTKLSSLFKFPSSDPSSSFNLHTFRISSFRGTRLDLQRQDSVRTQTEITTTSDYTKY